MSWKPLQSLGLSSEVIRVFREIQGAIDDLRAQLNKPQPAQQKLPPTREELIGLLRGYGLAVIGDSSSADSQLTNLGTGNGTVTSIGLSVPAEFAVSGSPVTTSGTFAVTKANQTQNKVWASPDGSTGQPTFRVLVDNDIPAQEVKTDDVFTKTVAGAPYANDGYVTLKDHNGHSVKVMTTA